MKTAAEIEALIAQYYDHKHNMKLWSRELVTISVHSGCEVKKAQPPKSQEVRDKQSAALAATWARRKALLT